MTERHFPLEDVGVLLVVFRGRFWARHLKNVTEFGEEELVIGPLISCSLVPSLDELCYGTGGHFNG